MSHVTYERVTSYVYIRTHSYVYIHTHSYKYIASEAVQPQKETSLQENAQ